MDIARLRWTLGLLVLGAAPTGAQTFQVPVETFTLANGLRVAVHEDHSAPLVAVNVWYHVGSGREIEGRSGFAHLFEHMLFQGSAHVGDDQHSPSSRRPEARRTAAPTPIGPTTSRWCRRTTWRPSCGSRPTGWDSCSRP